jgi:hypothetical protein
MFSDRSVTAATVLEADLLVRGVGVRRAMRQLERAEPELASYLMESATRLYGRLDQASPSHRWARAVHGDAVLLALVCIEAVRRSR